MSGICGIVNFDGAPVDPKSLKKMAEAVAFRGPDGINYLVEGNVGLACLALNTTPESLRETQPLVNRRGDLVLVADARVDNRAELIRTLTAKRYLQEKEPTDADLILAAYDCWGQGCPKQIIGDFAFAVWNNRERRLFCARDPVGIRPLFYCRQGQSVLVASAIASVLAGVGTRPPLNEPLIVDYLCWRFDRWVQETIYQTVRRLPASHSLEVRGEVETLTRYWAFGSHASPAYRTDAEYIEHFRELFEEAVRCRLRSRAPVAISVSGGLDSSAIACMVHRMFGCGNRGVQEQVRLFAWLFKDSLRADERAHLRAVLDRCQGFPATCLTGETIWGFKEVGVGGGLNLDEPSIFPITSMLTELLREAHREACRVVLTGEGGDQILSDAAYWRPKLIWDVRARRVGSELGYFWMRNGWSTGRIMLRHLVGSSVKPLVPRRLLRRRRRWARQRSAPAWVIRSQIELPPESDLASISGRKRWLPSRSATVVYCQLTGGWYVALLSYLDSVAAVAGAEYRMPYLDRRLIEFQLAIPTHLRFSGGLTKVILREATVDVLPEKVRQRANAAEFSEVVDYGLREMERAKVNTLLDGVRKTQIECLDIEQLASAWQAYYGGTDLPTRPLLAPLWLQDWLQSQPVTCQSDKSSV